MVTSLLNRLSAWISEAGWSSGRSEKPNDPPGKPAGFVCNNEASRPPFASLKRLITQTIPVCLCLFACGLSFGQVLPPPLNRSDAGGALGDTNYGVDSRGGGSSEPPTENSFAGNRLLSQAVKQLGKHRTIVAKIRHRVDLFGHELVGSGTYRQLDVGQDRLLRLELKIPLDNQMTSIQQVCDSRYLWTQQTMPDKLRGERTTISRIDLNEVRRAAFDDSFGIPSDGLLIGQGGLPQLLIELERHFAFHHVRPGTLHQVPVWIMWGEWKPSVLQLLFGDSSGKSGEKRPSASRDELLARLPRHAAALRHRDLGTAGPLSLPVRVPTLERWAHLTGRPFHGREC